MKNAKHSLTLTQFNNFELNYYFHDELDVYDKKVFPHHIHDRLEMYVLLDGDVSFSVESSVYKMSAGDAVIIKPNEIHNCILESNSVHKHMCLWFDSSNEFLFGDFLNHEFGSNNLVSPPKESKKRVFEIYDLLKIATQENDNHKIMYLTLELIDIFRKNITNTSPHKNIPIGLKNILIDIDNNFKSINSLNYFTDKYFISQSTLNRLFKEYLRTSPKYYLETKKLAHSRRLLKNGASVLYACMESGFTDYSNYIRLFKKRFSITPKQYKDNMA